ncbi:peroxiredoxin 1 [Elasticomyces elasticus]|nr:peroxiredoxin 1 [Elasticomyces elasticus]
MDITYGDREFVFGSFGNVDVSFGRVTVKNQMVGLASQAAWQGDGVSSGIIGMAYPSLTSAYPGTSGWGDDFCGLGERPGDGSGCNQIVYPSLQQSLFFDQKVVNPLFSLTLSRDKSRTGQSGYLTLGGVPSLSASSVQAGNVFASTKLMVLQEDVRVRYYVIALQGIVLSAAGQGIPGAGASRMLAIMGGSAGEQYIVDSGTTLNFWPTGLMKQINAAFSPPATLDSSTGFWFVDCNAKTPGVGVKIGGLVSWHDPGDLIRVYDTNGSKCISAIQDSGQIGFSILGDKWLNNVLAVFDVGAGMFRAETTTGPIDFHEFIGDKWVVLFSHPEDYTPVCTTELGAFAKLEPEFTRRGVKLIGLSANTVESHGGWIKDINEISGANLSFPIIGDKKRQVALAYDMLDHQDATNVDSKGIAFTIRSVFIIDPKKKIRTILSYPASTGRNTAEVLRIVDSLQTGDKHTVTTPINWVPGDDVIVHPSINNERAKELFPEFKAIKPYLRVTPLPKEQTSAAA